MNTTDASDDLEFADMADSQTMFENFHSRIASLELREIASHWNDARGAKLLPAWRDINPLAIAPYLPMIWSWRYESDTERFVGRLCGEAIRAAFGRSISNIPLQDFFLGEGYPLIYMRNHRVVNEPCFSRDYGAIYRYFDRPGIGERIGLPIADDGEHADGILGATIYHATEMSRNNPSRVTIAYDNLEYYPLT